MISDKIICNICTVPAFESTVIPFSVLVLNFKDTILNINLHFTKPLCIKRRGDLTGKFCLDWKLSFRTSVSIALQREADTTVQLIHKILDRIPRIFIQDRLHISVAAGFCCKKRPFLSLHNRNVIHLQRNRYFLLSSCDSSMAEQ